MAMTVKKEKTIRGSMVATGIFYICLGVFLLGIIFWQPKMGEIGKLMAEDQDYKFLGLLSILVGGYILMFLNRKK